MRKDKKIVVFVDEDGNEIRLEIVKEFEYKDKKYAVLFSQDDECGCEDDCDEECHDNSIYILRVDKNDKDELSFEEIADESLLKELVEEAEKLIYKEK